MRSDSPVRLRPLRSLLFLSSHPPLFHAAHICTRVVNRLCLCICNPDMQPVCRRFPLFLLNDRLVSLASPRSLPHYRKEKFGTSRTGTQPSSEYFLAD